MDQIFGTIERITFRNAENGFTVAKLKQPKKKDLTTIVGSLATLQPGEEVRLKGMWKLNRQHGQQFEVQEFSVERPKDLKGIEKYLASGWIRGIGPAFAKKIVSYFGEHTFEILDSYPERLKEVPGMGGSRSQKAAESWKEQEELRELTLFLQHYNIPSTHARRLKRIFGANCIERIKENPYTLAQEIRGMGFKSADQMAQKMGFPEDAPTRLISGALHVLFEAAQEGHTCLPLEEFHKRALHMLNHSVEEILPTLEEQGRVQIEKGFIWQRPLWMTEKGCAAEFHRLKNARCALRPVQTEKAINWAEEKLKITFAQQQKEALTAALKEKVLIITGGPGTGKSTITKALVQISEKITRKILLAAPTGRAAKRLSEITRKEAQTIHSLLQYDFNAGGFKRDRKNPLPAQLVIVDEVSMLDTSLTYSLLKALPDETRLILIGDVHQLPSVGAGAVLKDIIASNTVPLVRLEEIFRQAQGSQIITNAHRINRGEFPNLMPEKGSDFFFIKRNEPEDVVKEVVSLVKERLPKKYRWNPIKHIQVLSPMRKGAIGIQALNQVLQEALNPQNEGISYGPQRFCVGDKVMQLKNNYEKEVYNGDIGVIESIDRECEELLVKIEGREIPYFFDELEELTLSYACSVHKYQGSEAPCVVIPFHTSHFMMLQRNLLYTAVTRGKRLVVIVGTGKALAIAIKNEGGLMRYTGLEEALRETMKPLSQEEDLVLS